MTKKDKRALIASLSILHMMVETNPSIKKVIDKAYKKKVKELSS